MGVVGGHLGLKGTVTLSLSSRGARLNTSYFTTKTGCGVHTNEPIIGGFYHSIPSRFNLPNKHSLFPCVRVAPRLRECGARSFLTSVLCTVLNLLLPKSHLSSSSCAFLEVSLLLLSSTHLPFFPPFTSQPKSFGKAKHRSLPVCVTRRRWYVKQEAIRANYSDSSSQKKKGTLRQRW